jgi:2-polyprenyl-3-methyl-5-hydroxy-6-metoxy-1,4-benzoquinol methylase
MNTLISSEYKRLNAEKHASSPEYGTRSGKHLTHIAGHANTYGITNILDYGCGKAELEEGLKEGGFKVTSYDPCIEKYSVRPLPADMVVCTDVLEHVEPEYLDNVLADIAGLTKQYAYFNISLMEAMKTLPDGRNAHLIVQPWQWWAEKLREYFTLIEGDLTPIALTVLARSKKISLC